MAKKSGITVSGMLGKYQIQQKCPRHPLQILRVLDGPTSCHLCNQELQQLQKGGASDAELLTILLAHVGE